MSKQIGLFSFSLMLMLLTCLSLASSVMGQRPPNEREKLIPPSSNPLTTPSSSHLSGELIPPSRGSTQPTTQLEGQPRIIHRTFTVYEVVIRKNKDLNQPYCVPKGYEVFQFSHVLHKRTRFTTYRIAQDPVHRECVRLVATLESSSKKLFGFFLKQPTAKLHLKIHVVAKIPSPADSTLRVKPVPYQQTEPDHPPSADNPSESQD